MATPVPRGWTTAHTRLALGVSLAALALRLMLPAPAVWVELALLAGLVGVLGLPHGAVDHLQARALFAPRFGRAWPAVFAGIYLGAAALVLAAWTFWPPGLLAGFLALAIGHFGSEDTAAVRLVSERGIAGVLESALRGALPVVLPVTLQPAVTGGHFAALLPGTDAAAVRAVLNALAPAGYAYISLLTGYAAIAALRGRLDLTLETAVLAAVFAVLPPLPAFAVYFCIWHAPRHSLTIVASQGATHLGRGLRDFARAATPLTLITLAMAGAAWFHLEPAAGTEVATLQVVFIGLAALTVPHVGLAAARQFAGART